METKPGIKTTEFWVTIIVALAGFLNVTGIWDYVPNNISVWATAIVGGLYAASRGIAKQGVKPDA